MDFYTFLSKAAFKILIILIFSGIRWLYTHRRDSDNTMSHNEKYDYDEEEEEDDYDEEQAKQEVTHQAISSTIAKPVVHKKPQATPLPQAAAAHPSLSKPSPSVDRKAHLVGKRKLFKNGLLMDALMKRKDYVI
ncbi:protein of unknown function [Cardinium endosymbiont cEper1 of Encarsia pergandiella]|uniref:hypothetical protein n=1 Tax=Cardinium endosymbiont of Encarsia pergandiella TaxID=249402 RepID=UPI00027E9C12|nr:hypothetical protein [Cardinium endosymbiont of Encarsia pergandiella]CCM10570.1 protein of unknown function [Cardinium endosymbiont cEper1 of Encarsia pergandiella]